MSELSDLLVELEIDLSDIDKPEILKALFDRYESMVTQAEEAGEKQESVYKQTLDLLSKNEELVGICEKLRLDTLATMQKLIDKHPPLAIMLVELFQGLKQSAMYERDFMMAKNVVPIAKKANAANEDAAAKRDTAAKLRRLMEISFEFQGKPKDVIPVKESKTEGLKIKVSNLPRSESSPSDTPMGIAARNAKLRFRVNGKELPADTTPADLAHDYVSDRAKGINISWSAITNAVKATGQQVMSDKPWSVEVNGRKIEGWKVESK